jgi:hypothetical protein
VPVSRPAARGLAVGTTITAAIILIIGGVCHAMKGVVGLAANEFYVATQKWLSSSE